MKPLSPLSFFFLLLRRRRSSTLFPYTTLFRSGRAPDFPPGDSAGLPRPLARRRRPADVRAAECAAPASHRPGGRSEEHTSELQSHSDLVCRLLLEKKKIQRRLRP